MNNIQKLIPTAIESVETFVLNNGEVRKEFNGYISSLGASLNTSGLLPTMVFYSQEGKSKGDRTSVIKAIEYILKKNYSNLLITDGKLLDTIVTLTEQNKSQLRLLAKIEDAAIALKLAIRIFPKSKKESHVE